MEYKQIIDKLEQSQEYKDYKNNASESYLVHIFSMLDELNKGLYQVGYLNPKTDKVVTFVVGGSKIEVNPESEVLKDPESTIFPLDVEKVNLVEEKVIELANEFKEEMYPKVFPIKKFYILQHLDIGQVFNLTYMTRDFKTLNLKIDADSGEVLRHSLKALMDFDAPEKE